MKESIDTTYLDNRMKVAITMMAIMILFGVGVFLSRIVDQRLVVFLGDVQAHLRQKYGVSTSVGHTEVGLGSISLNEVSVGESAWLVVDRVEIAVSLNPFRDFLRPSAVTIGKAAVKIPWRKELWPKEIEILHQMLNRKGFDDNDNRERKGTGSRFVPRRLDIKAARIEVADGVVTKILGENVGFEVHPFDRDARFQADRIQALDMVDEAFVEGELRRDKEGVSEIAIRGRISPREAAFWSLSCNLNRDITDARCAVEADRLPPSVVRPLQRHLGSGFTPGFHGTFEVTKASPQNGVKLLNINLDGEFEHIVLEHSALALGVIGPSFVKAKVRADVDLDKKNLRILKADVRVSAKEKKSARDWNDALPFEINGDVTISRNSEGKYIPSGLMNVNVESVPCQTAFNAVPPSFLPELAGFQLGGTATLHLRAAFVAGVTELSIKDSRFDCMGLTVPEIYSASYLNGPFNIERSLPDGKIYIPVDPARPYFARFGAIPPLVRNAFVSSEDAGFFAHKGVEISAIVGAVERNTEEGRAVVGGSTITMQTVKNLFLARDKTISRKAQEIFLAWHIERTISKERILEIYLNMVEFGPGLYGIGMASQRFFNKKPDQLTLKEAIYLASLLPAPVPRYRYFCKGEITQNYDRILKQLLDRMLGLGRISADQHAEATAEALEFSSFERETGCARNKLADSEMDAEAEISQ